MAVCPTCRKDLRTCQPPPLEDGELRQLTRRTSDFIFLFSSPVQTQEENPRVAVGKRYSFIRQQRGLSLQEVASLTGLNPQILSEIEYGGLSKKTTFLDYVQYADSLGVSLEEMFSVSISPVSLNEDALLARVDEAIQEWMGQEQFMKFSISKHVGIPIKILKKYARTNSRLLACYLHALPHENLPFSSSSRHVPMTLLRAFLQDHNFAHQLGSRRRTWYSLE